MRSHQRAEVVLAWIQFSQICPKRADSLTALADELSIDRSSMYRVAKRLEALGLIRYSMASTRGAVWIWWVKHHENDVPDLAQEPSWKIRDITLNQIHRVPLSERQLWAKRHGICERAFNDFIRQRQELLYNKWKIVGWP